MTNMQSSNSQLSSPRRRLLASARAALILLLLINLINYIDRSVLASVLTPIGKELLRGAANADKRRGWLMTAFLLTYMLISPVFGWLADRFSRWVLIGVGVVVWSLASGGSGLAQTYTMLLATRMLIGVGEAAYGPVAPTIISDLYPVASRGQVLSWFYMAIPLGYAMGYVLGGLPGPEHWRWAFYAVVPPGILLGLFCFVMPDPPRGSADAVADNFKLSPRDYLVLLRTPSYVLNNLGMAALTFAIGALSQWMPAYIKEDAHWGTQGKADIVFGAITAVTGIAATLLGGITGDWLRTRLRGAYFLVSAAGLFLCFPFFLLMLFTPFPAAWVFVFLAEFFLFFNTGPSNTALANVTHPAMRATAFAINILFIHLFGDAISPLIVGALSDLYSKRVGFLAVGVMILAGALFWLWGARYLDQDTAAAPGRLKGFEVIR